MITEIVIRILINEERIGSPSGFGVQWHRPRRANYVHCNDWLGGQSRHSYVQVCDSDHLIVLEERHKHPKVLFALKLIKAGPMATELGRNEQID